MNEKEKSVLDLLISANSQLAIALIYPTVSERELNKVMELVQMALFKMAELEETK